ncbi:MAG: ABC transporter substrate-binding protein, partial [Deltaproteobacteria bacterium]|nr:ABC transporter substrate-binding protein [Deltaproteobacteria bacterium]
MNRRTAIRQLTTFFLTTASLAEAQQPKKVPRIGYLAAGFGRGSPNAEALRLGLRGLGYVEGQNIAIEFRSAEGNNDRLPGLAEELVRLKVDIIFAASGPPAAAAKKATSAIPIIFVGTVDPVASGLVASLARPGGNVTGFSIGAQGLYGKRLEILKETVPRVSRVGLLLNAASPSGDVILKETRAVGQELGVQIQSLDVRSLNDIDSAFEAATKAQVGALVVAQQVPINTNPKRIVELAAKRRLPAIYADTDWIQVGGLMSYGPSYTDLHRRSAVYVEKILKEGRTPADLPVQQPMKYELMINLKTAKTLGLTIPPIVLMRAERVVKESLNKSSSKSSNNEEQKDRQGEAGGKSVGEQTTFASLAWARKKKQSKR